MGKKRADSAHVMVEAMQSAGRKILPPACVELTEKELPFWDIVIHARAEWTDVDLIHAANLARCMNSVEENQALLSKEGDVIKNDRGTMVMNPRFTILEQLSRRSVSLSSKIQVHAAATMGEAKLQIGKNSLKRKSSEAVKSEGEDDDLIARPAVH